MKTWLRYFVWSIEVLIVLGIVYFEPTYCVRGMLWREPTFEGKPTSYWRAELERWDIHVLTMRRTLGWCASEPRLRFYTHSRNSTWLEQQRDRWLPAPQVTWVPATGLSVAIYHLPLDGPSILNGGDDAAPVLQALLNDPSPKVRWFAQIGLGMEPKIPGDE